MSSSLISRRRVFSLLVVLLLISSMLPSGRSRSLWSPFAHFFALASKPIAAPIAWASGAAHRAMATDWGRDGEIATRRQRDHLLQYSRELEQELAATKEQFKELKQVRTMLADTTIELQHARVLNGLRDTQGPTIMIDAGHDKGLEPGMIVANGYNLVGRLVNVGATTSVVQLITAPQTHLNSIIAPPADGPPPRTLVASVEVAPKLFEGAVVFTTVVPTAEVVEEGDFCHISDETWPKESRGFVIGRVMKINKADDKDNPLLRKKLIIQPMRSLPHLDTVVVAVPTTTPSPNAPQPNPALTPRH